MLDQLYISVFNRFKKALGKKASLIALYYITFLELSILFVIVAFFTAFASQMHLGIMSFNKALILFCLLSVFILFKNWMKYSGKKRNIINAKSKRKVFKLWQLVVLPLACLGLGLILLQSV